MFKYLKLKMVQQSENPHWLFNRFVGTEKIFDGRVVKFKNGTTGNHQIKHPKYTNWFDIPKHLVEEFPTPPHDH